MKLSASVVATLVLAACGSNETGGSANQGGMRTAGGAAGLGTVGTTGGSAGSPGVGGGTAGAPTTAGGSSGAGASSVAGSAATPSSGGGAGLGNAGGVAGLGNNGGAAGMDSAGGAAGLGNNGGAAGMDSAGGGAGTSASGSAGANAVGNAVFDIHAELASDQQASAPTTVGIVTWSVDAAGITDAHIDFGLDTTYGMSAPVDLSAMDYRTLLLGMKPEQTYHFRVVASDGMTTYTSDDQQIDTGAADGTNPITSISVPNAAATTPGFFVTSFWRGGDQDFAFIFDTDGDVVWWYEVSNANSGISRARMSADGQSIWLVRETLNGASLQRVSIDGLSLQTYANVVASHDITAVSGETMAYLDYSESDCDSIFEIDNAGTTQEVFESTNVTGTPGSLASCHGNAVRYSQTEDAYTFSDHRQDVAVVSRAGELLWKLTDKVSGGNASWGGSQHGHQLLDDSLLIYANDGAGNGRSQAIEFGLDGSVIKAFNSGGSATNFGDVQRLPNGNTVITYSTSSLIQEVDPDDNVVFEVEGKGPFGYVEFRESLYGPPIDIQQ